MLEALLQPLAFGARRCSCHRLGDFFRMPGRSAMFVEAARPRPRRCGPARIPAAVPDMPMRGRRMHFHRAAIGFALPGDDPHQRRLARAVRTDERNPLTRPDIKRHSVQHRLGPVVLHDVLDTQQNHAMQAISLGEFALTRRCFNCSTNCTCSTITIPFREALHHSHAFTGEASPPGSSHRPGNISSYVPSIGPGFPIRTFQSRSDEPVDRAVPEFAETACVADTDRRPIDLQFFAQVVTSHCSRLSRRRS